MKANIPEFHVGNLKNSHSPEITTEDGVTVYIAPEGYDNEYDLSPIFLLSDDDILALEDGEPVTATNENGDEELQV